MATFNTLEAAVRWGVPRFVHLSSETVPGFSFPERPFLPDYIPVDEEHPIRPQDPYATAKHFGELLWTARRGARTSPASRSARAGCSGRATTPTTSAPGSASRRVPRASGPTSTPTTSPTRSASPPRGARPATRSSTSPRRHRGARVARHARPPLPRRCGAGAPALGGAGPRRHLDREGAAGARLRPEPLWRDYLDDAGALREEALERLQRGETGVERGRRLSGG